MQRNFQAVRFAGQVPATDSAQAPPFNSGDQAPAVNSDALLQKLEEFQFEMNDLRSELNVLRRREDTLSFYMQRLDDELRLAARLQQDFLPKSLPQLGNLRFSTLFRPAGYVSGDLYDVMRLDESHLGFYIADAVGHGMPAALLTMFIKHALVTKEIRPGGYSLVKPSDAVGRLNEALIEQNLSNATFVTALYGIINIQTLEVTLACAGHPAPVILRETGPLENVVVNGALLGIFPGEAYIDCKLQLAPGDRLVLYTDGIEVAFCDDPSTGDPNRWRDELLARRQLGSDVLLQEFSDSADQESGSLEPKDDLTILVIEVIRNASDSTASA